MAFKIDDSRQISLLHDLKVNGMGRKNGHSRSYDVLPMPAEVISHRIAGSSIKSSI